MGEKGSSAIEFSFITALILMGFISISGRISEPTSDAFSLVSGTFDSSYSYNLGKEDDRGDYNAGGGTDETPPDEKGKGNSGGEKK